MARDASDVPDPGCAIDALDDLLLVVALVAIVLFVVFVGVPLLVAILDIVVLLVLGVLGVAARVLFRRPWVVEATSLTPGPVDAPVGAVPRTARPSAATRRYTWRVVGWRASGEAVDAAADALAHGIAMPPGHVMKVSPATG